MLWRLILVHFLLHGSLIPLQIEFSSNLQISTNREPSWYSAVTVEASSILIRRGRQVGRLLQRDGRLLNGFGLLLFLFRTRQASRLLQQSHQVLHAFILLHVLEFQ